MIAAEGYPGRPVTGDLIAALADTERLPQAYVLHAGTTRDSAGHVLSAGGRVLNVVGTGPDLAAARHAAYEAVAGIRLRGGWYRSDIAERAAALGTVPPDAVPPDAAPLGPAPPGAAGPGAAPPDAAPPGAAPLGAAPPGAAPPGAGPLGAGPLGYGVSSDGTGASRAGT